MTPDRHKELQGLESELLELRFRLQRQTIIGARTVEAHHLLVGVQREMAGGAAVAVEEIRARVAELNKTI